MATRPISRLVIRSAVAEGSSSGSPRRIRRIPSLGPSLPRLNAAATCTFTQQPFLNHAPITQPTTTHHPSCRIQERFRHNHPTSTILESTTSSCTALARPSTALADASHPTPPATRRKSRSCWQCCRERRRRREAQTPCKMGLSWGQSLKFPYFHNPIFPQPVRRSLGEGGFHNRTIFTGAGASVSVRSAV